MSLSSAKIMRFAPNNLRTHKEAADLLAKAILELVAWNRMRERERERERKRERER